MKNGKENEWKDVKPIKKNGKTVKQGFNEKWYGYPEMKEVVGVPLFKATKKDFKRIFKCLSNDKYSNTNIFKPKCKGLKFPKKCSKRPCNTCPNGKLFLGLDFQQLNIKYHIT